MKKAEIVNGGVYGNGKGRTRKIVGENDYRSHPFQSDGDCVQYMILSRIGRGLIRSMTRTAFASWAKERIS